MNNFLKLYSSGLKLAKPSTIALSIIHCILSSYGLVDLQLLFYITTRQQPVKMAKLVKGIVAHKRHRNLAEKSLVLSSGSVTGSVPQMRKRNGLTL